MTAAVVVGAVAGAIVYISLGVLAAAARGERLTAGGLADAYFVVGRGTAALAYVAALVVGWPVYGVMRRRGTIWWWQLATIGVVAGALSALVLRRPFTEALMAATGGGAGGVAAWIVVTWPHIRRGTVSVS